MRKTFLLPACLALLLVPAALATAEPDRKRSGGDHLISADVFQEPLKRLEARKKRLAKERREQRKALATVRVPPALQAIARCESGGNPRAVSANGTYRGKYQFSTATWAAVGGQGDPAAAPEAEQDRRAAMLYARSGPGQWPVCG